MTAPRDRIATRLSRGHRWLLAPVVASLLVGAYLAVSAFAVLPGEGRLKRFVGVDYPVTPPCGDILHRGDGSGWRAEAPLPHVRDESRATAVGDGIYIAGGYVEFGGPRSSDSTRSFIRYDTRRRTYEELPPAPAGLNHVGLTSYGGDVYLIGGADDPHAFWPATNKAWRYRVTERRWEALPPMPTVRGALGLAGAAGKIYAIGGRADGNPERPLATVEVLDLRSMRWSKAAPLPLARHHLGVAAVDGRIYAVGGRETDKGRIYSELDRYDPAHDRWTRLRSLPEPTSGVALANVAGKLVVVGGEAPYRWVTGAAWSYDPAKGSWSRLPSMPKPVHGYEGAAAGYRYYVFGGSTCNGWRPTTDAYSLQVR